ncbi:hypothetical protein Hanom_Chr14g01251461 [Helianthus anomalus]
MAVDAPAGYITLFWDFFSVGNFRLPVTKFFLEILAYYKFHISKMHPIGMGRVRHFEFFLPFDDFTLQNTLTWFRVFCQEDFVTTPKSFHDWKHKFFFIKVGVIPMKMVFRGKEEAPTETIQTPHSENWYQDLKDVPLFTLLEKALVGATMSLCWRMNREDKPVYMEGDKVVSLYVIAFDRYGGKMATIPKKPDEEFWYHRIARNFVFPHDEDLTAQPSSGVGKLTNLGTSPEKKKCVPSTVIAQKKNDAERAQSSKTQNVRRETKGKRKQADTEAEGQPAKKVQRKKITRRGNLDAFIAKPVLGRCFPLFSYYAY